MNKKPIVLDVETTIFQNGNPYSNRNRLCLVGIRYGGRNFIWDIEYGLEPYADKLVEIQAVLSRASLDNALLCGFNCKFDLGWLKRYGIQIPKMELWDCQLAHFIQVNQSQSYPDLDGTLKFHGLPGKSDVVEREYWSKGIDTPEIPPEVLLAYLEGDLEGTEALYAAQIQVIPRTKRSLLKLHNQDLLVLLDMEFNGLLFDFDTIQIESERTKSRIKELESELSEYTGNWPHFNFDSGSHLSCLIYGGTITAKIAVPYEHTYKTGTLRGTTATRHKHIIENKTYSRLCAPLQRTELKKAGLWSTDEQILRQLKGNKRLINLLLERSELVKLVETYYEGIKTKYEEMDWTDNIVHGQFNQVVARTGRLSSSNPNLQNMPEIINQYIISRF